VDRVIAVSRALEGKSAVLLGSVHDVRAGALQREGSVRVVAGGVPAASLGALAAFLLTGQASRDVKDRTDAARERAAVATPSPVAPAARDEAAVPDATASRAGPVPGSAQRKDLALPLASSPPSRGATPQAVSAPRAKARWGRPGWLRRGAIGSAIVASGFAALGVQQGLAARSAYADADAMVEGEALVAGSDVARYNALMDDGDGARRNAYLSAGAAVVFAATAGILGWRSGRTAADPTVAFRF
jgi:hypothetical protein